MIRHPRLLAVLLVLASLLPASNAPALGPPPAPAPAQDAEADPQAPPAEDAVADDPTADGQDAAEPEPEPEPDEEELEAAAAAAAYQVPSDVDAALELKTKKLKELLEPATPEKLTEVLAGFMALVRRQDATYQEARKAPEGSEQRNAADALGTDRDGLVARAEAVIELLVQQGGDVDGARATIAALREAEAAEAATTNQGTVPQDQSAAQSVSVEVLKAQLRPLTVEQVQGELDSWMALLQKKCLEVRKAEVAGLRAEDTDEIDKYNATAVTLRAERDSLLKRVKAVIDAFEAKGGDEAVVTRQRDYVASVVVRPAVTGVRAAWTTFLAWIESPEGGLALGLNVLRFLAIVFGFRLLGALLSRLLDRTLRTVGRTPELLRNFFVNTLGKGVFVVGLVVALGQVGVDIGPLVAAIGGAAFVIGFALQGTLSNFAAGLMILIYRPYNVGDIVEIGGTLGTVDGQNLVSTTIKTFDNKTVIVPNNMIWGDVITNATKSSTRRVDMVFGIGYGDDMAQAERILREILDEHDKVLAEPAPNVSVHELGDSSVNFIVRPWVHTADYWNVYWDVTRRVKERFDAEGVSIPFPQRDVHVFHDQPADGAPGLEPPQQEDDRQPAGAAG